MGAPAGAPAAKKGPAAAPAAAGKPQTPGAKGSATPVKAAAKGAAAPAAATPKQQQQPAAAKAAATPKSAAKAETPKSAAKPAAATPGKAGSQFVEGSAGDLGRRKFDNGLEVVNTKMGDPHSKAAVMGKRVQMRYVGRLKSNGKVFDSSKGAPFTFRLGVGEVIKGWDVGVKGMRVGDKRTLVIPPQLAYGKEGVRGAIPPNATLEFDIELVNVLDK